ncbi:phosphoethanolamine transferase [Vibrio ponticus]|uniref:Phosphoethanolamine transferase n=1 Tax=Vibrio ponticus TaxID=265668 RepID=A0A3N3DZL2_9VIBR|nr:phosphoethanolamine transferase [Vibrio ponticus]
MNRAQTATIIKTAISLATFTLPILFVMPLSSVFTGIYIMLSLLMVTFAMTLKSRLGNLVKLILIISCIASILSLTVSGGFLATGAFHSILLTNSEEVVGYFQLIDWTLFIPCMFLTLAGLSCFWTTHLPFKASIKATLIVSTLSLAALIPTFKWYVDQETKTQLTESKLNSLYLYQDVPAYNLYRVATLAFIERYRSHIDYGETLPDHFVSAQPHALPQNIIVVIGESSRRASYSLYGSQINATPNLLARSKASAQPMQIVDGAFAPAPNTRESVPRSFSFATTEHQLFTGLSHANLIDVARSIGYHTTWVTTQTLYTRWDSFTAKVATSADKVIHTSDNQNRWHDRDAVEAVKKQLIAKDKNQFIVLHLSGEHADYAIRNGEPVPDKHFEAIKAQLSNQQTISSTELAYLSSIHMTDDLLDNLVSAMFDDATNSLLVYFSDHGEVIGKGHGLQPIQIEEELAIPYLAIGTLANKMARVIDCYRDHRHQLYNNSYFPEVLLSTLGMEVAPPRQSQTFTYYSIQGETEVLPTDFSFTFFHQGDKQCKKSVH